MTIEYSKIPTEKSHSGSKYLDQLSASEIFNLMLEENISIPSILKKAKKNIVSASSLVHEVLTRGGRILFVGAGTSGRLGVLESAELPPTFNTSPNLVRAVMAGGKKAVFQSIEGAEDNEKVAPKILRESLKKGDLVVGIAASGVTPFVWSALRQAKKLKAKTILITCNPNNSRNSFVDIFISLNVGPEILSGSTRLKSGTVTKMVLNMLTTIAMVECGKVYGNRMVDLQPKSKKLKERGIRMVQEVCNISRSKALVTLMKAQWRVKNAILMIQKKVSYSVANERLLKHGGNLRKSLE